MTENTFTLTMPNPSRGGATTVESAGVIVCVGANGAGKTKLGSWIELHSPLKDRTHRVSAQKSLTFPRSVNSTDPELAINDLLYGSGATRHDHKQGHRWGGQPEVHFLNDYELLVKLLFSEEAAVSSTYRAQAAGTSQRVEPPITNLDRVKRIWESVLPLRQLHTSAGKVEACRKDTDVRYSANQMSDGERVIFYLIGQCLAAPEGGAIVIDEPELHLHRSIQSVLWDAIEKARPDCLFVYLTHDLNFAASRMAATKIWLREYADSKWDWEVVPSDSQLPEPLLLEILGSRKPVLFIEGEIGSLDHFIYSRLYPEFTVVPRGGCDRVVQATRAFSDLTAFHDLKCRALVDRDHRTAEQVAQLENDGVHVTTVCEVENLFLTEEALRLIARESLVDTAAADAAVTEIKRLVLGRLQSEKGRLISAVACARIEECLRRNFDAKAKGEEAITAAVEALPNLVDAKTVCEAVHAEVERILAEGDYTGALRVFDNKGLLSQAAGHLGRTNKTVEEYLRNLLNSERGGPILDALRKIVPTIAM